MAKDIQAYKYNGRSLMWSLEYIVPPLAHGSAAFDRALCFRREEAPPCAVIQTGEVATPSRATCVSLPSRKSKSPNPAAGSSSTIPSSPLPSWMLFPSGPSKDADFLRHREIPLSAVPNSTFAMKYLVFSVSSCSTRLDLHHSGFFRSQCTILLKMRHNVVRFCENGQILQCM